MWEGEEWEGLGRREREWGGDPYEHPTSLGVTFHNCSHQIMQ